MLRKSILTTLTYFDIFNHPLTTQEVHLFLGIETDIKSLIDELQKMVGEGLVSTNGRWYALQDIHRISKIREQRNDCAMDALKKAIVMGNLIYRFPFVKAVFVSGSLSKGVMDKKSDIDYFVITEPGRLWMCRVLLMSFKKICLLNSRKYFCINYFIDTDHLTIEEKNQFTATELITLIPLKGQAYLKKLFDNNSWVFRFLPNFKFGQLVDEPVRIVTVYEKILNSFFFDPIEKICYSIHVLYWRVRFGRMMNPEAFKIAMKSKAGISKSHPLNAQ